MPLKTLLHKRTGNRSRFMDQQLRFDAMDSRRLLQRLDHMSQELRFHFAGIVQPLVAGNEEISDNSLTAFINEKGVTENASALDRRIARQNFRVDVAQNHFRGSAVVPGEKPRP